MSTAAAAPIRIVLVDDHAMVRAGLHLLMEDYPNLIVVGEAADRATALELATAEQPDIILLDIDLGGSSSLDFLTDLRATCQARVILLTGVRDPLEHQRGVRLGAAGLLLKEQSANVLAQAITKVHAGELWLDPGLMARVLSDILHGTSANSRPASPIKTDRLTERERDVVALICEGLTNKQIAERMVLSETTVRHHLTSIFDKLSVANRLELVIYAFQHELVKPGS
jgi:DNA-binding NarL/FixJ family response regulator